MVTKDTVPTSTATTTTTKPSIDRFIDLVNTTNRLTLSKNNLDIGLPTVASATAHENTTVKLTSKTGAPHRGSTTVKYHRMPLSEMFKTPKDTITITAAEALTLTLSGLVGLLNTVTGTKMDPSEFVASPLKITKLPATYMLTAKPESYVYTGSVEIKVKAKLL